MYIHGTRYKDFHRKFGKRFVMFVIKPQTSMIYSRYSGKESIACDKSGKIMNQQIFKFYKYDLSIQGLDCERVLQIKFKVILKIFLFRPCLNSISEKKVFSKQFVKITRKIHHDVNDSTNIVSETSLDAFHFTNTKKSSRTKTPSLSVRMSPSAL